MVTTAVRWLRDYLAARDLDTEVAGGFVVERVDVDHLSARPIALERVPAPMPPQVRSVAITSLVIFGLLCAVGASFVVGGGVAVVAMPIVMGREGVGTAMITLFAVCVTAVTSGILLLAARGAARVIRRERRGVRTLYLFSLFGLAIATLACGIGYWLKVAFFASDSTSDSSTFAMTVTIIVPLLFMAWFARAAFVLRQYAKSLNDTR